MRGLLVDIFGEAYAEAAFWVVVLVAVAILLWVILRITRGMTPGTFISGARGRQPRLAVTDATPVDNHRRLVLVRRDDVEHLILIGGPSDVVVESNIRAFEPAEQASAHSPAEKAERKAPAVPAPTAAPAAGPRPARPAEPQPRPAPARPAAPPAAEPQVPPDRAPEAWHPAPRQTASELPPPAFTASRTVAEVIEERARLQRAPQAAAPQAAAAVAATAALNDEETAPESAEELALDDLSDALDEEMRSVSREARPSLEDEMSRLLDELTDEHRTNR